MGFRMGYDGHDNYMDNIRPNEQCQCVTCGDWFKRKEMLDGDFEDGVWCSFRCWYRDGNSGTMKSEILTALQHGKANEWILANHEFFTNSTYERFKRVINRINEKAAQSDATLKAA